MKHSTPINTRTTRSGQSTSQMRKSFGGSSVAQQLDDLNKKFDEKFGETFDSQERLEKTVEGLKLTINKLEDGNKIKINQAMQVKTLDLAEQLKRAEQQYQHWSTNLKRRNSVF
jgi:hypothetical protein